MGRKKTRNLRSKVKKKSKVQGSEVRSQSRNMNDMDTKELNLNTHGIEVHKGLYTEEEVKVVQRNVNLHEDCEEGYPLQDDMNRIAWPQSLFSKTVMRMIIEKTKKLFPAGTKIMEKSIVAIAAYKGARQQKTHVDTKDRTAFSVLHIVHNRMFHITQFGDKPFKLNRGDIVVMKGNVCHAGAKHVGRKKSVLFHVPVGYKDTNIHAC